MPITAGHVPGLTSGLRRVPMDPGRFHSGRWFLLVEGALVSVFGIAGLVSAALHPHAGPTGAPVLGLTATPLYSGMLLAFGVAAMACSQNRRAAITVTALSAVAYTILLFISSVATARDKPTPLGFHAAEVLLHGVLAVVNLALLMWLIPDELGDEIWAPRRRRGRSRRQPSTPEASTGQAPVPLSTRAQESGVDSRPPRESRETDEPPANEVEPPTDVQPLAARATTPALPRGAVVAAALLLAVVGVVIWIRRR
ncbi:DUF4383 domain-containing protein [Mycobacterium terramassiliense]|uniref:Transmembrane protein n=1 Tax=Mycobacterium terramassiliense TaxID=1841859 RepID=A0A2U3NG36_9MYCO|nr:DUF4383 domain-containing protein [Mycobacterium terramassiliense]SPM30404.1 hypothetical protein HMPREF0591_2373 [Mycobacterium terramassiliense]